MVNGRRQEGGNWRADWVERHNEVVTAERDGRRDSLSRLVVVLLLVMLRLLLLRMVKVVPLPPQMKRSRRIARKGDCEGAACTPSFQPSLPTHGA
jgi:hypothetical protein